MTNTPGNNVIRGFQVFDETLQKFKDFCEIVKQVEENIQIINEYRLT